VRQSFSQPSFGFWQFGYDEPLEGTQAFTVLPIDRKVSPSEAWSEVIYSLGLLKTLGTFEFNFQPLVKPINWYRLETPQVEVEPSIVDLRSVFEGKRDQWLAETSDLSSLSDAAMHPAYQEIIGLGPAVLPLIFEDLAQRPVFWFWALAAITRETPEHEEGDFESARRAWLDWGRARGYL
jgi:hypothetical protein